MIHQKALLILVRDAIAIKQGHLDQLKAQGESDRDETVMRLDAELGVLMKAERELIRVTMPREDKDE